MSGWPWPLEGVQDWFEGLWDYVGSAAVDAVSVVSDWIWGAIEWLSDEMGDLFTWVGGKIGDLWDDIDKALTKGWTTITTAIGGVAGDVISGLEDALAGLGEGLGEIVSSIGDTVKSGLEGLGDALSDTATWIDREIGKRIGDLTGEVTEFVTDALKGGMDWVTQAMAGVAGAIGDGLKDLFSWIMESLQDLATGMAGALAGVRGAVEPLFSGVASGIMGALTGAVKPGSPDEEIEKAAKEFTDTFMKRMAELSKTEAGSVPSLAELLPKASSIVALNMGAAVAAEVAGTALDQANPMKNIGFANIAMDLVASVQMPAMIGPILSGPVWPGVILPMRYRYNEMYPTSIPDARWLPDAAARGALSEDDYRQAMKFHALDASWASAMLAAAYRTPLFSDLQLMYWRGVIGEDQVGEALARQGMLPELILPYLMVMERVPGPGDLVRMAVREAFDERPGDEEIRPTFIAQMGLQGYIEEAVYWFWRAHWVLPSVGQVFDMYHRGIEMPMSVTEYLKWADYAPEWRAPLERLSWSLPGRIDARWMFRWGKIGVGELQDLLEKQGLDPAWSGRVADATAKNQWLTEINRLRDNVKRDFVKGYVTDGQLRANLEGLGYPPEWIEFHVRDAIEDGERELKDDIVRALGDGYMKDLVTDDELEASLKAVIVQPRAAQMEMERLYIRKYRRPKDPTPAKVPIVPLSTLKRAFRDQIIGEPEFRAELEAREYDPRDIDILVAIEARVIAEEMVEMPEKVKTVTLGTLRTAFREGIIRVDQLVAELTARKYTTADIELIVAVEEAKIRPPVVPVIPEAMLRRAFREAIISEAALREELAARGYLPADIDVMVAVEAKAIEEAAEEVPEKIPVVSVGTLRMAFRAETITETDLVDELVARRYIPEDIAIIVELEKTRKKPPKVPMAPVSTLRKAFRDEMLTEDEFRRLLADRDYSPGDIDLMVGVEVAALAEELVEMPAIVRVASVGTLRAAYREGVITSEDLASELEARGYGRDDIAIIIALEEAKMARRTE